jgi:hypothetical protein
VHVVEHRSVRSAPPGAAKHLRGPVLLLRGWAAAVVATLLAAGSHTLAGTTAGGHDAGPAPVVWLLTLALAGPLCTALAGRSLSWWRLWSAVGSSQLLFHWLYSQSPARPGDPGAAAASPQATLAGASAEAAHAGHAAHAGPALRADALPVPDALPAPEALPIADHLGLAMAAAHVLAAVATVLLLRRGEATAARVVGLAVGLVLRSPGARLSRWVPALRPPRLPSRPLAPAVRAGAVVLSVLRWRGPPAPVLSP